jgi:starvation-inducible DNA-binding protein
MAAAELLKNGKAGSRSGFAWTLGGRTSPQTKEPTHMTQSSKNRPTAVDTRSEELTRENTPESPVVQALRRQAANAFVLYANYKHYHWQTYGPLFRDLHKLFDKFAEEVLSTLDEFAERVRMIGQDPPAHLLEAADLASVAQAAPETNMRGMIEEANRNALLVVSEMRRAARLADDHDDPGTADLFSRSVQIHEKQEWWLRDLLKKGDGLCQ